MVEVFEPVSKLLKKYIASIYLFEKGADNLVFTSYPSTSTAVGLFRNAALHNTEDGVFINNSEGPGYLSIANNRLFKPVTLHYSEMVDEIAINFRPLGFVTFAKEDIRNHDFFIFHTWDGHLKTLFETIDTIIEPSGKLKAIEDFLLTQIAPLKEEGMLLSAMELLGDADKDYKVNEIAAMLAVHPKYLYRVFVQRVGCSLAHYRKIVKFRRSVQSRIVKGSSAKLTEVCYENDFTDQSYFIKQYQELTGNNPRKFFNDISSFGNNNVIFRFH